MLGHGLVVSNCSLSRHVGYHPTQTDPTSTAKLFEQSNDEFFVVLLKQEAEKLKEQK